MTDDDATDRDGSRSAAAVRTPQTRTHRTSPMPPRDWDDAFANMAHIPGSAALPDRWAARAGAYRAATSTLSQDIPYGDHPRERLDIVYPPGPPKGLVVFVHGGYWMRLDKSFWTDLAQGACARGWAVCLPSYVLAPEARIGAITRAIARAIATAADRVPGPLYLAGHSAGGHLVSRMICADSALPPAVLARIAHTLSISGVHDLRPLLHTAMNATLRLDAAEARAESPVLHLPHARPALTAWVGGGERPEFIRQSRLMAQMWLGLDADAKLHIDGAQNHFSVLDGLRDAQSPITRALFGDTVD